MKKIAAMTALALVTLLALPALATDAIRGTSGNDKITTGPGSQTIRGLGGDDVINSGVGADTIYGGRGDDELWSGKDDDVKEHVYGGRGDDRLHDNDTWRDGVDDTAVLVGGSGRDVCTGHKGITRFRGCEKIRYVKVG